MDRAKASIAIIVLLIAIVGVAWYAGVQNARVGQRNVQTIFVQVTDPVYGPKGVTSLNVSYDSVGIHVTQGNLSQWVYYNASGSLNLLALQNRTYSVAQFAVPYNVTIDQAELRVVYANASVGGRFGSAFVVNGLMYAPVANTNSSSSTVLLDISPTVWPVPNQTTLYLAVQPSLSAGLVEANASVASSVRSFANSSNNISIASANISAVGNTTNLQVTLQNRGDSPQTIRGMILVGNFTVRSGISNASILAGIVHAVANANTLQRILPANITSQVNSTASKGSGILGELGSLFNNSGALASIGGKIGGAISNISAGLHITTNLNVNSTLPSLNTSSYKALLVSVLGNATSGRLSSAYLSNQTVGGLTSIVNNLGGISNSSIEGNLAVGLVRSEYNKYVNASLQFNSQVSKLNAAALVVESNGTVTTPTPDGLAEGAYGYVLAPHQTVILTFSGVITYDGVTAFDAAANNTYKIIISGDNTTALATVRAS